MLRNEKAALLQGAWSGVSPSCAVESSPSPAGKETLPASYGGGNAQFAFENGNHGLNTLHCKITTLRKEHF